MKRALTITFLCTLFLMTGCMKDVDIFALAQEQPTTITYTVTAQANNNQYGTVTITPNKEAYTAGETVVLNAVANSGYKFVKWSDGVTDAYRSIIVNRDETFTATFEANSSDNGIRVTFGNYNWTAGYYGIINFIPEGYNVMRIIAYTSQYNVYPEVDIAATPSLGTHTETTQNGYMSGDPFNYVDYYENTSLFSESNGDTIWYGDWWAKTATINTTKFDATAGIVTTVVNANMFSALEAFVDPGVGIDAAATKNLSVNCNNVELISNKRSAVHVKRKAYKFSAK